MSKFVIECRGNPPVYMVNNDGEWPDWQELEKAKVFTIIEASEQLHSLSEKCVIREIEEETVAGVEEVALVPMTTRCERSSNGTYCLTVATRLTFMPVTENTMVTVEIPRTITKRKVVE